MFSEENDELLSGLPGCCPGCQLPWTSCICSGTPWAKYVTPMYYAALYEPPAFWRKKDRDDWVRELRRLEGL